MADQIREKERQLAELEVDKEIATTKADIAEKRALEHEMRKKYGRDWRKILGYVKALRPNKEVIEDLYILGGKQSKIREMSRPDKIRIRSSRD